MKVPVIQQKWSIWDLYFPVDSIQSMAAPKYWLADKNRVHLCRGGNDNNHRCNGRM